MRNPATFAIAVAVAWLAARAVTIYCARRRVVGRCEDRGLVAYRPLPRVGGIAMAVAFVTAIVARTFASDGSLGLLSRPGIVVAGALLFAVGLIDHLHPLSPRLKLAAIVVGGLLVVASGVVVDRIPLTDWHLPRAAGAVVTVGWIALVVTAWNFIDGLDGLAAGMSLIAVFALWMAAAEHGAVQPIAPALAGSALGFLAHNRPPARLFMGDCGSFFLGFWIAILCVPGGVAAGGSSSGLVLAVLAWPLADATWAITRRLKQRTPFRASGDHLHYLLSARVGHRPSVLVALAVAAGVAATAVLWTVRAAPGFWLVPCLVTIPLFCGRSAVAGRLTITALFLVAVQLIVANPIVRTRLARRADAAEKSHIAASAYERR